MSNIDYNAHFIGYAPLPFGRSGAPGEDEGDEGPAREPQPSLPSRLKSPYL